MATRGGGSPMTDRVESEKAAGRKSATDALRKEAEREWVESDRKAAKGRRRTKARFNRQGEAISRPKGKTTRAKRGGGREAK